MRNGIGICSGIFGCQRVLPRAIWLWLKYFNYKLGILYPSPPFHPLILAILPSWVLRHSKEQMRNLISGNATAAKLCSQAGNLSPFIYHCDRHEQRGCRWNLMVFSIELISWGSFRVRCLSDSPADMEMVKMFKMWCYNFWFMELLGSFLIVIELFSLWKEDSESVAKYYTVH